MRKIVVLCITAVTVALLSTAIVAAEKKAKDTKAKAKDSAATAACPCETQDRDVICLQYSMPSGSYCMWYALHVGCGNPVAYYGSCQQVLPQNCQTGQNCIPPAKKEGESLRNPKVRWEEKLAKDGFDAPPDPKPTPGILTTEAYIKFSKNPSGGKVLFARILHVRMIPSKFGGQFNPPIADKPEIEDTHGFQVASIPAGATVFSMENGEVVTVKRDVGKSPRLVNVMVRFKDNVWLECNVLLDKKEPVDEPKPPRRKRAEPAKP